MKFVLFALLAMTTASAADACTLNYREVKSALDVNRAELKHKGKVTHRNRSRTVNQTVVRKDGQAVSYAAGGCEHYSESYTFAGLRVSGEAKAAFALAADELKQTPVTADAQLGKQFLLESLLGAVAEGEVGEPSENVHYFACGDGMCYVGPNPGGDLSVNYSFAL